MVIPIKVAEAIQKEPCPICLGRIRERTAAMIRSCNHIYCIDCIRKWSRFRRNCPLCSRDFDGWFFNFRASTGNYEEEHLWPLKERNKVAVEAVRNQTTRLASRRGQLHNVIRRSRPLPWRRSFGQSRFVTPFKSQRHPDEPVSERVLEWRASIYKRRLRAVPLCLRPCKQQNIRGVNAVEEKILQRLEPWIRRELQAILGDPDPSVIVHLATSLWISNLEKDHKSPPNGYSGRELFVQQLKPFLHDWADMFWHELREPIYHDNLRFCGYLQKVGLREPTCEVLKELFPFRLGQHWRWKH